MVACCAFVCGSGVAFAIFSIYRLADGACAEQCGSMDMVLARFVIRYARRGIHCVRGVRSCEFRSLDEEPLRLVLVELPCHARGLLFLLLMLPA